MRPLTRRSDSSRVLLLQCVLSGKAQLVADPNQSMPRWNRPFWKHRGRCRRKRFRRWRKGGKQAHLGFVKTDICRSCRGKGRRKWECPVLKGKSGGRGKALFTFSNRGFCVISRGRGESDGPGSVPLQGSTEEGEEARLMRLPIHRCHLVNKTPNTPKRPNNNNNNNSSDYFMGNVVTSLTCLIIANSVKVKLWCCWWWFPWTGYLKKEEFALFSVMSYEHLFGPLQCVG